MYSFDAYSRYKLSCHGLHVPYSILDEDVDILADHGRISRTGRRGRTVVDNKIMQTTLYWNNIWGEFRTAG